MNIKTGLTALLLSLPLLANAGAREELMALEATKTTSTADAATITTSTPAVPAPGSLMLLPDGRRANMKEYAVVLFMQAHCQYSAKFDPLLKGWADEHAIRVYPYTLDGGGDVSYLNRNGYWPWSQSNPVQRQSCRKRRLKITAR